MNRVPLRIRLTAVMTLILGLTLGGAAFAGIAGLDHALRADTEANASAVLASYLGELDAGVIASGADSPQDGSRFVYLDQNGKELTPDQFDELLQSLLPEGAAASPAPSQLPELPAGTVIGAGELPISADGKPRTLSGDEGALVVGAPVLVGNTPLTIGVSSPLQPVTDSTSALARVLLILVPVLTAAMAAVTWAIVGRALRPVDAITARVEQISTQNLDQRVPESAADDEIGRLAITMNRMLARLQLARDRQRQFVSDASHELNSPITATRATLEVAQRHPEGTDWEATVRTLQEENAIMASLAGDLLTLARLEEENQDGPMTDIDLEELCSDEADRQRPGLVRVHIHAPGRVRGNRDHLTRAIRNLVDNAVRYAEQRVDITISQGPDGTSQAAGTTFQAAGATSQGPDLIAENLEGASQPPGRVVITVSDDGPGIPEADLQRVFERFSQLDQSRTRARGRGAGLGLAIARQIIAGHNGTVVAGNRPGGGAVFTVTLPAGTHV